MKATIIITLLILCIVLYSMYIQERDKKEKAEGDHKALEENVMQVAGEMIHQLLDPEFKKEMQNNFEDLIMFGEVEYKRCDPREVNMFSDKYTAGCDPIKPNPDIIVTPIQP